MTRKLRQNIVVSYHSPEQATAAFEAAKKEFGSAVPASSDFNRVENHMVIWMHSNPVDDASVRDFLLKQVGAFVR